MSWLKLDDKFRQHPKVLSVDFEARWLHVAGMGYAAEYLTDGFIPERVLCMLSDVANAKASATHLLEAGLWEVVEGGYQIHDYLQYNPSKEEVLAMREARIDAGKKGGLAKAKAHAKQMLEQKPKQKPKQTPSNIPYPINGVDDKSSTPPAEPAGVPTNGFSADGTRPAVKEQNASMKAMIDYFAKRTHLQVPSWDGHKAAASNLAWRQPLDEILCLVEWDIGSAQRLIDASLERLRGGERKLTVSDPRSIIRTARALKAEQVQPKSHARKDADGNIIMPNL